MTMKNPLSRASNLVMQELGGELLIYDLKINKAFCLNETSGLVWQMCDGTKSIAEISRLISKKLKTPVPEDLVWLAVDQLEKENLLEGDYNSEARFEGLSRREVIRKIGVTSMVALPIISSLVAPTAVMAQSSGGSVGVCQPCSTSADCAPDAGTCKSAGGGTPVCAIGVANGTAGEIVASCTTVVVPDCSALCSSVALTDCCSGRATANPGPFGPTSFICVCAP